MKHEESEKILNALAEQILLSPMMFLASKPFYMAIAKVCQDLVDEEDAFIGFSPKPDSWKSPPQKLSFRGRLKRWICDE